MITRAEFQRICDRDGRARRTFGKTICLRIEAAGRPYGPWPACRVAMERAARREHARLSAAVDQYETALHEVPQSWIPPAEDWP